MTWFYGHWPIIVCIIGALGVIFGPVATRYFYDE